MDRINIFDEYILESSKHGVHLLGVPCNVVWRGGCLCCEERCGIAFGDVLGGLTVALVSV